MEEEIEEEEDEYSVLLDSDFIRNSAEMNETRPEDLDEVGESSTSNVSQQFLLRIYMLG